MDGAGRLVDLTGVVDDITGATLAGPDLDRIRAAVDGGELPVLDPEGLRVGAPLARPGKVVCIGLNYRDHAAETGAALPGRAGHVPEGPDTVVGPDDEVLIPRAA
jgi:2-keto-4-pentenoate hydratase/2-oxohepta-3-ene-1,7-dioic acid hydratase in catechol pathway